MSESFRRIVSTSKSNRPSLVPTARVFPSGLKSTELDPLCVAEKYQAIMTGSDEDKTIIPAFDRMMDIYGEIADGCAEKA